MMDPTTSAVLTGVVVVAGQWVEGKKLDGKTIIGGTFYAILITVVADVNEEIASVLGVAVLITALYAYAPQIIKSVGLDKSK